MLEIIVNFKKYFFEYLQAYKWLRFLLLPAICMLTVANYLEIQTLKKITEFLQVNTNNDSWTLVTVCIYMLTYTFLKFIVDVFSTYMVSYITQKAYTGFFSEYLQITYYEFHKYGIGEKHYNIRRRAVAIGAFFTVLFINFVMDFMFFCWVTINVCFQVNILSAIKIILGLLMFLTCMGVIHALRSKLRRKVNVGFELNAKKMYDVLFNYERIVVYNNIDVEMQLFYKAMGTQVKYNRFFWISFEAGNMLADMMFCLLSVFIFIEYKSLEFSTTEKAITAASVLASLIKAMESKVKFLAKLMAQLITHYTNFDQSIIKHAELENNTNSAFIRTFEESLVCKNVELMHFNQLIFSRVNCEIFKGKKIALTGQNGCGKTSFLKILLGFYKFQGNIEMDGVDYSVLNPAQLRHLSAYVPQDSQLFNTSILENIKVGNKNMTNEEVIDLCVKFGYHELFKGIGYDFTVGSRGKRISGGERQKIAFMRAVAKDTPILFMDEPTANMDHESEQKCFDSMNAVLQDKTVLSVVHNLKTLKKFDQVFFFHNKILAGIGSFDDLYANNNKFREFYISTMSN